ncbi:MULTISPECIES: aspartate/glutamate racemase family protein [unclassified Algibacter]|uniref:aspartate/glutamate racemase family protein n=1 Tax=unclassified Algibacter TaxID=2615009 RepID=UPI00131B54C2|nr:MULTISPECIES: aspartate/glutamate racemase family protein [unclassified Algibacter]MCL5126790.1 aspartate/glutamate racemase family protein [Algibacter sp. L4_22]
MKTIGLIGGITPESTVLYYRILNDLAQSTYGESHSAKVIINSVDFGEIAKLQKENRWDLLDNLMCDAAVSLEKAGATCVLICANTMHLTIEAVKKGVSVPVIHIAEATSKEIITKSLKKVALLGTKYTMEKTFYTDVLKSFGIETIIPELDDRNEVHRIIYDELSKGKLTSESKAIYLKIIQKLIKSGAEGIILGCTEIPLLIEQNDVEVPVFDTTTIHAKAAFELAVK